MFETSSIPLDREAPRDHGPKTPALASQNFLFNALLRTICMQVLFLITMSSSSASQESAMVHLEHEKDISVGRNGYNIFAWSPDSKLIAFVRFEGSNVAIADVESGKVTDVPGSQIDGMKFLAWSLDSKKIAFGVDKQLRVMRISDNKILLDLQAPSKTWFDYSAAFSNDGKSVLVQTPDPSVLLNKVDIATGHIEPVLPSPMSNPKRSGVHTGRFERAGNILYFSVQIDSFVGEPGGTRIANGTIVPSTRVHPSCYVFDLGSGQDVASS